MKTALITGCSTGIGYALAETFLQAGYTVIATARRSDTLQALQSKGATTLTLDVTDSSSIAELEAAVAAQFGQCDVLINNAGIANMGPVADMPLDVLRAQLETNTIAPIAMIQSFLPLLQKARRPLVVNIGSISGVLTTPFAGAYCASKAALHSLNDALRMEIAPFGVEVLNVQPGSITSALGDNATAGVDAWLTEKSRYWPIKDAIYGRARAQQEGATSAADFAAEVLAAVEAEKREPMVRIGNNSKKLPFIAQWLPTRKLDALLSKRFSLLALKRS